MGQDLVNGTWLPADLAVGDGVFHHQDPGEFRSMVMVSQFS